MINVLVTGGNGQLGESINFFVNEWSGFNFIFLDADKLDITKKEEVDSFFKSNQISFCVNCAAYTNVDKSESDKELASAVNEIGAKNLAQACDAHNAKLIHVSTDFVFDGQKATPYVEDDKVNPLGAYGKTKWDGEEAVKANLDAFFIIRTSWLYSEYCNNFLKTMLRLGNERDQLSVVYDQVGTPTYAKDLAKVILKIIEEDSQDYGLYHFSNEGVASWYDFAKAIFDEAGINIDLFPIKSEAYPTPAKRPSFSVLDKDKIKNTMNLSIPYWRDSLKVCLHQLEKE